VRGGEFLSWKWERRSKSPRWRRNWAALGKEPGKDVEIIFTGCAREKTLRGTHHAGEGIVPTKHEKIMVLRSDGWNGKNNQSEFTQWLDGELDDLYRVASTHDAHAIRGKLSEILPEYVPPQNSSVC